MRKTVTLLACLFFASVGWGQYSTTYTVGVTDITSYLPTTNAWKALPQQGQCKPNSLSIGGDGVVGCIGLNDGYVWTTTAQASSWTELTSGGTGYTSVSMASAANLVAIGPSVACTNYHGYYTNLHLYNGSSWSTQPGGACPWLAQISLAPDGTLAGTYQNLAWMSSDGGKTWTQISGGSVGPNLSYVSAADQKTMCGSTASQVFLLNKANTFVPLATQPATSGISGCGMADDSVFAWGAFGVQRYDLIAQAWNNVTGLSSPGGLASIDKGFTLALDSSGHPYHLNVYAGFVKGTTNGSLNGCPLPAQTCNSGVLHTASLNVTLPHGLAGGVAIDKEAPTVNVNASSFDFSPVCDPFFGAPSDPECQAQAAGSVICSQSGENFQTGGPSHPPPIASSHWSIDMRAWDSSIDLFGAKKIPLGWVGQVSLGSTVNGCAPATHATCGPPVNLIGPKTVYCYDTQVNGKPIGDCTENDLELEGLKYGQDNSLSENPSRSWWVMDQYYRDAAGVAHCSGSIAGPWVAILSHQLALLPCQ